MKVDEVRERLETLERFQAFLEDWDHPDPDYSERLVGRIEGGLQSLIENMRMRLFMIERSIAGGPITVRGWRDLTGNIEEAD